MKQTFTELSCIALLWTGAAGVVASLYVGGTHAIQLQSLCAFSVVVASGCIAKIVLGRNKPLNEAIGQFEI